jgi:hypothetical protein
MAIPAYQLDPVSGAYNAVQPPLQVAESLQVEPLRATQRVKLRDNGNAHHGVMTWW